MIPPLMAHTPGFEPQAIVISLLLGFTILIPVWEDKVPDSEVIQVVYPLGIGFLAFVPFSVMTMPWKDYFIAPVLLSMSVLIDQSDIDLSLLDTFGLTVGASWILSVHENIDIFRIGLSDISQHLTLISAQVLIILTFVYLYYFIGYESKIMSRIKEKVGIDG